MGLVGDRERERAAGALRRHYLEGRLSEEELDARVDAALRARTRFDLLLTARSLPRHRPVQELVATTTQAVSRALTFALLAGVWVFASLVLLVALLAIALVGDVSPGAALGFPLAWGGMTWLVWRHWRHGARR